MNRLSFVLAIAIAAETPAFAQRVQLSLDSSEADAALVILDKEAKHVSPTADNWAELFTTPPYRALKEREASMNRAFTDDAFKDFLSSSDAAAKAQALSQTLRTWRQADLTALGKRMLAWLPGGARIHAKVYPEIKPATNSFVWGEGDSQAIFLYLNPALSRGQFENTVAHECHHIGLNSMNQKQQAMVKNLSEAQQKAVRWIGAFGEGEAMLAASGSPYVHPHAEDDAAARARWDADMARFNEDLAAVERFLLDILDGSVKDPSEIARRAQPFYGGQGAWYTVGYRMASLVEIRFGRRALTDSMLDPRNLLLLYNRAASERNRHGGNLALWSPELLARLQQRS